MPVSASSSGNGEPSLLFNSSFRTFGDIDKLAFKYARGTNVPLNEVYLPTIDRITR